MHVELEIVRGEVHDSIVARMHTPCRVYESLQSPEIGHISQQEFELLAQIFFRNIEEKLEKAFKGEATK